MKTKQPLTKPDVPPLCWIRFQDVKRVRTVLVTEVLDNGVEAGKLVRSFEVMAEDGTMFSTDLVNWNPCYKEVEEFHAGDYNPGQIVDIQTARKLHAAGVGLECSYNLDPKWESVRGLFNAPDSQINKHWQIRVAMPPGELTAEEARAAFERGEKVQFEYQEKWRNCYSYCGFEPQYRYRLKPAPVKRTMRQNEFPERIIILDELYRISDKCYSVWHRDSVTDEMIEKVAKDGKWATNLDGPWNDFTVTEDAK